MRAVAFNRPRTALALVIAIGFAARIAHYAYDPDLWHDEAALVVNVLDLGFLDYWGRLKLDLATPPGLLSIFKVATILFGESLAAIRLPSVLASLASLVLFAAIAKQVLAPWPAIAAAAVLALSDRVLWHACEAKPYSTDILFATSLLAWWVFSARARFSFRVGSLALLAPIGMTISFPAIFSVAGAYGALALESRPARRRMLAMGALGAWLAVTFVAFSWAPAKAQRTEKLDACWTRTFPDLAAPARLPVWFARESVAVFDYACRPAGGLLMLPAIVGVWSWRRAGRNSLLAMILLPVALTVVAALLRSYPFGGYRTMAFAIPLLALAIGEGVGAMFGFDAKRWNLVGGICAAPLAASVALAFVRVAAPWERTDTEGPARYVLAHRRAGEPVYFNNWESLYYLRPLGKELREWDGHWPEEKRPAWLVATSDDPRDREALLTAACAAGWQVRSRVEFHKAVVVEVEGRQLASRPASCTR